MMDTHTKIKSVLYKGCNFPLKFANYKVSLQNLLVAFAWIPYRLQLLHLLLPRHLEDGYFKRADCSSTLELGNKMVSLSLFKLLFTLTAVFAAMT